MSTAPNWIVASIFALAFFLMPTLANAITKEQIIELQNQYEKLRSADVIIRNGIKYEATTGSHVSAETKGEKASKSNLLGKSIAVAVAMPRCDIF